MGEDFGAVINFIDDFVVFEQPLLPLIEVARLHELLLHLVDPFVEEDRVPVSNHVVSLVREHVPRLGDHCF